MLKSDFNTCFCAEQSWPVLLSKWFLRNIMTSKLKFMSNGNCPRATNLSNQCSTVKSTYTALSYLLIWHSQFLWHHFSLLQIGRPTGGSFKLFIYLFLWGCWISSFSHFGTSPVIYQYLWKTYDRCSVNVWDLRRNELNRMSILLLWWRLVSVVAGGVESVWKQASLSDPLFLYYHHWGCDLTPWLPWVTCHSNGIAMVMVIDKGWGDSSQLSLFVDSFL